MNKKIIACFNCDTNLYKSFGADKLIKSWYRFHPDIPIIWYNENVTKPLWDKLGLNLWGGMAAIMLKCKTDFNADLIIKLDADSLILNRFDDIINCDDDIEIFGVRNDGEHHKGDERKNRPDLIKDIPNEKYLNCGLIATSSEQFLFEWLCVNQALAKSNGGDIRNIQSCPYGEQGSYNVLTYENSEYKTHCKIKILDEIGNGKLWGSSANMPSSKNHEIPESIKKYHNGVNQWASWQDIEYKDNGFYLKNNKIFVLHMAGGGTEKIKSDMFSKETWKEIEKIINE